MSEQLDKVSGDQVNAHDLTWSYACVLKVIFFSFHFFSCLLWGGFGFYRREQALASRDIAVKSFQTFN